MPSGQLKRREFITLLGGAASAWPLAASAQQRERMRRIGVLMNFAADDPEAQARNGAFLQGLSELGWKVGRNARIDYRWGAGDGEHNREYATELVALAPDVIIANGAAAVRSLQGITRTVSIVFAGVADPVGEGLVASLARPASNATGFTTFEFGLSGKWLELLKEIAPRVEQTAVIRDQTQPGGVAWFAVIQAAADSFKVELSPIDARNDGELDSAVTAFSRQLNGGLIVLPGASTASHRDLIVALAARYRLPAVYPFRYYATSGGLASYGPDVVDQYHRAASYVDRILKGEKPADLPVQQPTKYELVINLKTAKALGLDVPAQLLARADDVIE
jgi:putative tryptophan/tyrosine transport system substrate-binding protein